MTDIDKNQKASLSWVLSDFLKSGEEPPECVLRGKTEGQVMRIEEVETWFFETKRFLLVFREDYPHKFQEQYSDFLLNLDYLRSIGKISEEQKEKMAAREDISFDEG